MLLPKYKTLEKEGFQEIVIRKSRFIGRARPVSSEQEAQAFIESVRKEHWSATHNCYAYVIGDRDECQKQSDDGEPSRTAGKPILEVIKNQSLKNTAVVVTRYFGGIKLGASGLIRAYTDGAVAGIEAAGPVWQVLHEKIKVTVDYTWQGKLDHAWRSRNVLLEDTEYTDKVTYHCLPTAEQAEDFMQWVTELTQGRSRMERGERIYVPHSTRDFA